MSDTRDRVEWKRVAWFYAVALGSMSLVAAVGSLFPPSLLGPMIVGMVAMFSPLVATVTVHRLYGQPVFDGLARFRLSRWLLAASLAPVGIALATLLVSLALPGVDWDWEMNAIYGRLEGLLPPEEIAAQRTAVEQMPVHPFWLGLVQALIAGATINAVFAFGEEVGWRGFLLRELAPLGFWPANLLTGVLWGLWHAPLILQGHNYPTHRIAGIFLFTAICALLAPLHGWVRVKAGTVWAAAIFHGTFNAAAGLALVVVRGPELLIGVQGLAGLIVLALANLALLAARPRLDPVTDPAS